LKGATVSGGMGGELPLFPFPPRGVLETLQCRDLLKAYVCEGGAVVCIIHDIDEICAYLGEEQARPAWGEPFEDIVKQ